MIALMSVVLPLVMITVTLAPVPEPPEVTVRPADVLAEKPVVVAL